MQTIAREAEIKSLQRVEETLRHAAGQGVVGVRWELEAVQARLKVLKRDLSRPKPSRGVCVVEVGLVLAV